MLLGFIGSSSGLAPQSGIVHQLAVHTVGGVIANGETIMLIVPRSDELVVEAKIAPGDIDQVAFGADASVRIMAGNRRTTPQLLGKVTRVSADLTQEQQTNQTYYLIRIAWRRWRGRQTGWRRAMTKITPDHLARNAVSGSQQPFRSHKTWRASGGNTDWSSVPSNWDWLMSK